MKLLFFILTLLYFGQSLDLQPTMGSIYVGSSLICPAYVCQNSIFKTGCVTYSGSQMVMEGCLGDWYCHLESSYSTATSYQYGTCTLRRKVQKFHKNVGSFCYQDSDCKSNYCAINYCSVKNAGATCSNSYQCGKGMFCEPISDTCQQWLTDGSSCSSKTSMCAPGSGCLSIDGASTPVCTKMFSLSTNLISNVYGQTFSYDYDFYCSTGSITSNGKCSSTALASSSYPKSCSQSTDCVASSDAIYSSCTCLPNTEGIKYCMPFAGDIPDMMNKIKSRMYSNFQNCYNYEIAYNENGCGMIDIDEDKSWAPQVKKGTWGSCYDDVGITVTKSVYTYSGYCPSIKCNTGNNEEGKCFKYTEASHLFTIQACPSNYMCGSLTNGDYSYIYSDITCKQVKKKALAHKGEWCWVNSDCYSGMCLFNKVCSAYSAGQTCTSSNQCDKGLLCISSSTSSTMSCQNWINLGGACSTENYNLCRPYSICLASSASATTGSCQPYFSLAGGSTAYVMTSIGSYQAGDDYLCKSGAWDSVSKVCFSSSHKLVTLPKACTTSADCPSINQKDSYAYYSDCGCYPNTKGQNYCKAFPADVDSGIYTFNSNYCARDLSTCFFYEIGENFGGSCGTGDEKSLDYWGRSVPSSDFPSCGKDVLYDEQRYVDSEEQDYIFNYVFSSRLLASICLMLGILLFK